MKSVCLRVAAVCGALCLAGCALVSGGTEGGFSSGAAFALSETAAGPIDQDTPYSKATLESLFPNFRFDTVRTVTDGHVSTLLAGFDEDGFQAIQVEARPDRKRIASVQVVGPAVNGPNGEEIGMSYQEAGGRRMSCKAGTGQWTGLATCARTGSHIAYIFAPDQYLGPSGKLPPPEDLRQARLVRMVWSAS